MNAKGKHQLTKTQIDAAEKKILTGVYSGPLPPPEIMAGYQSINAEIPAKIMAEFEKQAQHVREREMLVVKENLRLKYQGQCLAFFLSASLLALIGYCIHLGNITFAGISSLAFFGVLIKSFMPNFKNDKKE